MEPRKCYIKYDWLHIIDNATRYHLPNSTVYQILITIINPRKCNTYLITLQLKWTDICPPPQGQISHYILSGPTNFWIC